MADAEPIITTAVLGLLERRNRPVVGIHRDLDLCDDLELDS